MMRLLYDWPTIEEYQDLCLEEKWHKEVSRLLERNGEFEEARCVRAELKMIKIKKICYEAALRLEEKRKAATAGTVKTA